MFRKILLLLLLCSPPVLAGNSPDTLNDIRESGTIRIAHPENVPPFSFMENGEPTGYSINICRQIVSHIAKQLGRKDIRIRWRSASTAEALRLVADGVVDMDCGITSISLSRQQRVDFSNEIYVNTGDVLVQAGSDIKRLADLDGKKIGETVDLYSRKSVRAPDIDMGTVDVSKGKHTIEVKCVGKNPKASKHLFFGIDYIQIGKQPQENK